MMEKNKISMELRLRIKEYLRYSWKEEKAQSDEDDNKVLSYLPLNLKQELLLAAYGSILNNKAIFFENFSKKCLNETIYQGYFRQVRFTPGDIIFDVKILNFFSQKKIKGRRFK